MNYELWDIEAHFFLGRFASEEEALRFVRKVLDQEGDAHADKLELAIGENGAHNLSGAALADKAQRLDDPVQIARPGRRLLA
ncbi:MAG: hypothetical protein ACRDJW_03040 [Thermomicrobiales bacterium]